MTRKRPDVGQKNPEDRHKKAPVRHHITTGDAVVDRDLLLCLEGSAIESSIMIKIRNPAIYSPASFLMLFASFLMLFAMTKIRMLIASPVKFDFRLEIATWLTRL